MAAINPRINVTFEESTAVLFMALAKQEHKSVACVVRELALEALEKREDFYLAQLAEKLDKKNAKTYSHDQAWI
jgi:predicted DNA-binding protein